MFCIGKWTVPEELLENFDESLPILILNPDGIYSEDLDVLSISSNYQQMPKKIEVNSNVSLHDIHKFVYEKSTVPENFVDKLIAFHLGHLCLRTSDLTEYFLHLDQTFAAFAHNVPAFRDLTPNDQNTLLLNNSPLYFQLHLAK